MDEIRLALARDIGAIPAPFNSWLLIQGLETLTLRMEKHCSNALAVAKFLEAHPKVKVVNYPGLESSPNYAHQAEEPGLFEVDNFVTAEQVIDKTRLFSLVTNIGDSKSIITHPASTTHQQLSPEELAACGVGEGLIRLSVGLEDPEDLIADLAQALAE